MELRVWKQSAGRRVLASDWPELTEQASETRFVARKCQSRANYGDPVDLRLGVLSGAGIKTEIR